MLYSYFVTVAIIHLEQFRLKYKLKGTKEYIGLVHAISLKLKEVHWKIVQMASGRSPSRQWAIECLLSPKTTLKLPLIPRIVGTIDRIM